MEPVTIIEGTIAVLDRSDVDTDQIIPKQFLKRIERTGFGEFLFYDWVNDGEVSLAKADVLVAGRNFGCGSSREHAVWAIQQAGYRAVVAPSFADIFYSNATKNGLLPIAIPEEDVKVLMGAEGCQIDLEAQLVTFTPGGGAPRTPRAPDDLRSSGGRVVHFDIEPEIKHRLLNGLDDVAVTLSDAGAIDAYERDRAWPAPSTTAL